MKKLLRTTLSIGMCLTLILMSTLIFIPGVVSAAGTITPQDTYTVTFETSGGSTVLPQNVGGGGLVTKPANPTYSLRVFVGWYKDINYTSYWNFATDTVNSNITLYARWMKESLAGLTAQSASYSSVKLSWTASTGANGYDIYRSTNSSTGFVKLLLPATTNSYTCTGLTTNKTYYFKVQAFANIGTTKVLAKLSASVSGTPVVSIPGLVRAYSTSYTSIRVSWQAVTGATGYEVIRKSSATGIYYKLPATTATSLLNTGLTTNHTYYYRVRAYRKVGLSTYYYSTYSAVVSAKPVPAIPTAVNGNLTILRCHQNLVGSCYRGHWL